MAYSVVWHERALDDLKALDKTIAGKIVDRIKIHLVQDPERLGKPLKGVLKGLFRYRWGDYRIIYTLEKADARISVLFIGHRKNVYRR